MRNTLVLLASAIACIATICVPSAALTFSGQIVVGKNAPAIEQYAAKELQRYLYQISGSNLPIADDSAKLDKPSFVVGTWDTNKAIQKILRDGKQDRSSPIMADQAYRLEKTRVDGVDVLAVSGKDEIGTLYGVYGLLQDYYGISFYMGGDVLPDERKPLVMPDVNEANSPRQHIRGFLPWTNFPQSATVYSFRDYKFIIDQMTKMRMNFILIHNYTGDGGHNEMFHNVTLDGFTSRVWMATARSGHGWGLHSWEVKDYKFGAADLFDDEDFGADCALHNKSLSNIEVFRKGASLFQQVIEYAHTRGVKIGLGLDVNTLPGGYSLPADDPRMVNARADQIITDYPNLDYMFCFRNEGLGQGTNPTWQKIFDILYSRFKKDSPGTRLAVSGWGMDGASVASLPKDVIAAPIAPYSAGFESGTVYPDREYWGCPWLERDFNSSVWYYPYDMNLSDTVKSYRARADNMRGFFCLTWRLTDGVDAKMGYIARAPWDYPETYTDSKAVYHDYAARNYGSEVADDITGIINENEAYACSASECENTPTPSGKPRGTDIAKAASQLGIIDRCIAKTPEAGRKARLLLLRNRIAAVKAYCEIDQDWPAATWESLPGAFPEWAASFRDRVTDVSSLGNVESSQNRLVRDSYVTKEDGLRRKQTVRAPSYVEARGTRTGAVIAWRNTETGASGFNIYRNGVKLNNVPVKSNSYTDKANGAFSYAVTAISKAGEESPKSVPSKCAAGKADTVPPNVVVVSPPTSHPIGQPLEITARVLDGRSYESLSATVCYRAPGSGKWKRIPMERKVRAAFGAAIPGTELTAAGLEYYIETSDGSNKGRYPKTAPKVNASVICFAVPSLTSPGVPGTLSVDGETLTWPVSSGDILWYRIYRSRKADFKPGYASLVTYVDKGTTKFEDAEPDFDGQPLDGRYYYRVTSVDHLGNESAPTNQVAVTHKAPIPETGRHEAEDAAIKGGQVYSDPAASGGQGVGFFKGTGSYIEFDRIPKTKQIILGYSDGQGFTQCTLYVNGKNVGKVHFRPTRGWYNYSRLTVDAEVEGTLKLQIDDDDQQVNKEWCANIDYVLVPR